MAGEAPGREPGITTSGTFRLEGEYWTIGFDTRVVRLRDSKGLRYLSRLLGSPGRSIAATALARDPKADPGALGATDPAAPDTDAERARVNVTRAIRTACRKISTTHTSLAEHLETTVRTGLRCSYRPDSRVPIHWTIEPAPSGHDAPSASSEERR